MKKSLNASPLVSVIMPAHNAEAYVSEAINSLLRQTYSNIEIILVDDRSTDRSWEILQDYARRFPKKIRAVRTKRKTNAAGNGAMNYGFRFAKGEFIARMDADDISYPERIEKQVLHMLAHPEVFVLGTQADIIDANGATIGEKRFPIDHDVIYEQYGILHPIVHPSVMIRRSLLPRKNKIYEMVWDVNDDYYTFFKFLHIGAFHNLPEKLIAYRVHGKNASLQEPKKKFWNSVRIRLSAIQTFQYRMSLRAWILLAIQCVIVGVLPERLIVPLYLCIRGMMKISRVKWNLGKHQRPSLAFLVQKP